MTNLLTKRLLNNRPLSWLLALNFIGLILLGGRYWYLTIRERQEQHKRAIVAANILVRAGFIDAEDAVRLTVLDENISQGARISNEDLDWCLGQLRSQGQPYKVAARRRACFTGVLVDAIASMDRAQRGRLFQALAAQMAMDDPQYEIGSDISSPASLLARLGDTRAIPLLQAHLGDARPFVHRSIQRALKRLESKATE